MARLHKRDQSGASLVEAAIVTPLLVLLVLGLIWGALILRTYLTVGYSAKVGARAGSIAAASDTSDYTILHAIQNRLTATGSKSVIRVVIYHATDSDTLPSSGCASGIASNTAPNECNVYGPADFARPITDFGTGSMTADTFWPASSRSASRSDGPKYIGVSVVTTSGATGLGFVTGATVTRHAVVPIESDSY